MRYIPEPYQLTAIEFLKMHPVAALLLDCGLGKTAITMTAGEELGCHNILVVAPRLVVDEWVEEGQKWDHLKHLKIVAVEPDKPRQTRKEYFARKILEPADIHVISRDAVDYLKKSGLVKMEGYDMIVLDESTSFKNYSADRTLAVTGIVGPRKVLLTGTPMPKDVADLFAQYRILDGGIRLEKTISKFREKYMRLVDPKRYIYAPLSGSLDTAFERVNDITISMRSCDKIKLPPLVSVRKELEFDEEAKKTYKALKRKLCLEFDDSVVTAKNSGILTNKLSQIANGFVFDTKGNAHQIHNKKIEALQNILEATAGKDGTREQVLVAYNFREDRRRILELCEELDIDTMCLDTPQAVAEFKKGSEKGRVGLIQPKSNMYGLNLQEHCHRLIWYSLPWSYDEFYQTVKRVFRKGQNETTYMHTILIKDSVDYHLVDVLNFKQSNNLKFIELAKAMVAEEKQAALIEERQAALAERQAR